ncbi:MAG: hypothetical protein NT167_27340 [Verrucomicrobia bacterium]|nr:hypothetical protein [Verrucomicrobiota bacterium]
MTGTSWLPSGTPDPDQLRVTQNISWPGGDNPNHFYTTQDLFDNSKTASMLSPKEFSFIDRLKMAGTNNDSYTGFSPSSAPTLPPSRRAS